MEPSIALALMAYRSTTPLTVQAILRDLRDNPEIAFVWGGNDALIDRSRSMIATYFLRNDTLFGSPGKALDVLIMVDHDISWAEGDLLKIAQAAHDKRAVIGGVYPKRGFGGSLPLRTIDDKQTYEIPSDHFLPCQYVSAGFMAIPRLILAEMAERRLMNTTIAGFRPFFLPLVIEHDDGAVEHLSEDWAFCHRVRQVGRRVFADLRIQLQHTGEYGYRVIDSISLPPADDTVEIRERGIMSD